MLTVAGTMRRLGSDELRVKVAASDVLPLRVKVAFIAPPSVRLGPPSVSVVPTGTVVGAAAMARLLDSLSSNTRSAESTRTTNQRWPEVNAGRTTFWVRAMKVLAGRALV